MTNRIAALRLEQFEINQRHVAYSKSDAFVDKKKLEERVCSELNDEVHDALLQVVEMRRGIGSAK